MSNTALNLVITKRPVRPRTPVAEVEAVFVLMAREVTAANGPVPLTVLAQATGRDPGSLRTFIALHPGLARRHGFPAGIAAPQNEHGQDDITLALAVLTASDFPRSAGVPLTCGAIAAAAGCSEENILLIERTALRKVGLILRQTGQDAALREALRAHAHASDCRAAHFNTHEGVIQAA